MKEQTTAEYIESFFAQFTAFSFKAGDVLIHSEEVSPSIYYLKSGVVKQLAISPAGQEITITLYTPGSFFPLIWVIKNAAVPYDFKALTDGHGWKAPRQEVITLLKQNAAVTFDLCTRLLSGLEGLGRKLEYALHATAQHRVSEALLTLGYRFGKDEKGHTRVAISFTHQELAEMTGLTRETVTRELKELREKGLIDVDGKSFVIPNLLSLERSVGLLTGNSST